MIKKIGGIIGWVGTALVFASVAIRFLKPVWNDYSHWGAWAGLVCILVYVLSQWQDIAGAFRKRQTRLGTMAAIGIAAVFGILVALNYIGARQNKRWDLTEGSQFTLSDQTKNVLRKLDAPLKVFVFDQSTGLEKFKDKLREYEYLSKQVSVEYVDADRKPTLARQYGIQTYGTVVFEYKGRTERVTGEAEQDLTNGIIKAVTGTQRKIYFLAGHGERDLASSDRTGYSTIKAALERENYAIDSLVLVQKGEVPADAAAVIVAGAKTDLLPPETDALTAYLAKGGKLLLMIDPPEKADSPDLAAINGLAHDWGMDVGRNVVVDASGIGRLIGTDASVPVAASYPPHPITERFGVLTAYPLARSIKPVTGGINGHNAETFVQTGERSWAETDIAGLLKSGEVTYDQAKGDQMGPVSIAATAAAMVTAAPESSELAAAAAKDQKKPETRVAVVGDSDFAANYAINIQGNRDLFMNIAGWLTQQENLIAIRPKEAGDRRLTLTADQGRSIGWLALLIIPGAIFAMGVYTWWRRR
jgi:ABC-type uncharacterized transport system involved in gliding motility auxiliary subunit